MTTPTLTRAAALTLDGAELDRWCELLVFGDDLSANTDEQKYEAIHRLFYTGAGRVGWWYQIAEHVFAVKASTADNVKDASAWIWSNRAAHPWQSELEACIASWRAMPREFHADANMDMLVLENVRETWGDDHIISFSETLNRIWGRRYSDKHTWNNISHHVGDYARAACAALCEVTP